MPATAGRVRMPANNRVHSSAARQTHGIWQSAIGYDPYTPTNKDDDKKSGQVVSAAEPEGENAYASFQGLLQLAKITISNSDEARGACKKCGRVGHLTFQCRNFLSVNDELNKDANDDDVIREVVLKKLKGEKVKLNGKIKDKLESGESSEEEDESESSDSDYDSEIERIIAGKYGKKSNGKGKLYSSKEEEDDEGEKKKKRGRSKKRRSRKRESSDSEDEDEGGRRRRKKRKEKRSRRDDDSSDDGKERRKRKTRQERRSHRHSSEDSEDSSEGSPERRLKRRSRRVSSSSDSDVSAFDDSRVGRDKKRAEKNSRKRHRERENCASRKVDVALLLCW